jgi:4-carboxymuconolactone decarboxylase
MEHHPAHSIRWTPAPAENFTGRVLFGRLSDEGPVNMLGVHFDPAARTDWHSHPAGQVLYVISGAGYVQDEDGTTVEVGPGDTVHTPPGQVHWHGARPHSPMLHLSITSGGDTVWLTRKVSDEEYGR